MDSGITNSLDKAQQQSMRPRNGLGEAESSPRHQEIRKISSFAQPEVARE